MPTSKAGTCDAATRGFTLVELLVVLSILAITLSYVVPKLAGGETAELKGSARRLVYTVRRLSDEALFTKEKRVLTLDLDSREYWDGDGGVRSRVPSRVFIRNVVIGTEPVTTGLVSISFFPSGFRDEASITLSGTGGTAYTVVIPALGERFEVRED
jgi:prepilin-type N-terminal cleavage/methylation domain-containing protein